MRGAQEKIMHVGLLILIVAAFGVLIADMQAEAGPRDVKNQRAVDVSSGRQSFVPAAPGHNIFSYNIVKYSFEDDQFMLWTQFDNTADIDTFFHVDDFHDLDGFAPLEGTKSMWCGAGLRDLQQDPNKDYFLCWVSPGYGNDWNQALCSKSFSFADSVTLSYALSIDFEGPWDRLLLQYYDSTGAFWDTIAFYGQSDPYEAVESYTISPLQSAVAFRFIFHSDELVSSEDEEWGVTYNGAVIIDSITVSHGSGNIHYENFEDWPVGSHGHGEMWYALKYEGHGIHSYALGSQPQFVSAYMNYSKVVLFTNPTDPATYCYNQVYETCCTPYCNPDLVRTCLCQDEMIVSPEIDLTMFSMDENEAQTAYIPISELQNINVTELSFDVYIDLPRANYVFYFWQIRAVKDGCAGPWIDRDLIYFGEGRGWKRHVEDISDLLEQLEFDESTDRLQIAVGVVDMVMRILETCDQPPHTPAPYFDNIQVDRHVASDPQWEYEPIELFADNFPSDPTDVESWVRADMSKDINGGIGSCRLGDSVIVSCSSTYGGGIDSIGGRPAVFMHVYCEYAGDPSTPKPNIEGPSLEGSVGSYYDHGYWTVIQGEVARPYWNNPDRDKYMFDLNDSLLTRGYKVRYFFEAFNKEGGSSTLPDGLGDVTPGGEYFNSTFVFRCLPMYFDNFIVVSPISDFRKDSMFWLILSDLFPAELFEDQFNLYGALGPEGAEPEPIIWDSNLAGRISLSQLQDFYNLIVWNSGSWSRNILSDGDARLLTDWLEEGGNLWMIGDNLASWVDNLDSPDADCLLELCGVELVAPSYFDLTGGLYDDGNNNPIVEACDPIMFFTQPRIYLITDPEIDNTFDVLAATGTGTNIVRYQYPYSPSYYYTGVRNETAGVHSLSRTVWFGFNLDDIRETEPYEPMHRNILAYSVFDWLSIAVSWPTGDDEIPHANALYQNKPNPFNPSTEIRFSLEKRGHVRLDIYDITGRRIKKLVNDILGPGAQSVRWDGVNESGVAVASGVYFYKIKSGGFEKSKKMVLLR